MSDLETERLNFYKTVNAFLSPENQGQHVTRYANILGQLENLNENLKTASESSSRLAKRLNSLTFWIAAAALCYAIVSVLMLIRLIQTGA